jgi:hypothetical protein
MKKGLCSLIFAVFFTLGRGAAHAAGTRNVELTIIYKGETYSFTQAAEEGRPGAFSGEVQNARGGARALIFNSTLAREGSGDYRLQYQAELGDEKPGGRPPVQVQADIVLPPNRKELTAEGADWKLYLKIKAQAVKDEGRRTAADAQVTANAKVYGLELPLRLMISPGTQATYVAALDKDGTPYAYSLSLLAGRPDAAGRFTLQYALQLKTPGREVVKASGETTLKPGAKLKTAAAGNAWKLELRASKP